MKCPKCGYNSFDHLESCKKCGEEMGAHKAKFGLRSLFLGGGECVPALAATPMEEPESKAVSTEAAAPEAPADPTDFGFDFMSEEVSDEDPPESSLDELLGPGPEESAREVPAERTDPVSEPPAFLAFEGAYDSAPTDGGSDFDIAWEDEPLIESAEISGGEEMFESEESPEFQESEPFGSDFSREGDPLGGFPGAFDRGIEPISEFSREELPEFEFGEEEPAETQDEFPGSFEQETAGEPFARGEQPPIREDDPTGGAAEPLPVSDPFLAAEPFFREELPEEPSEDRNGQVDSTEPNLAELFLESLDDAPDFVQAPKSVSAFSPEEDPLENISSEVMEVEPQLWKLPDVREDMGTESAAPGSPPLTFRAGAGIADLLILAMVFILFLAAGEVALGPGQGGAPSLTAKLLELAVPYFLVLFAVCFCYFTLFHFLIGQTPGKMLFRIRVVGEEGGGLMFSQAFLRSVGGLLSLLPAGLGYLPIVLDGERRGWNDRLANSRVIPIGGWENMEELNEEGLAE